MDQISVTMHKLYTIVFGITLSCMLLLSACTDPEAKNTVPPPTTEQPEKESKAKQPAEGEFPEAVVTHDGEQVKQSVDHLFEIVSNEDFSMAAQFLAYRGEDKSREWKDGYDYEVPEEKRETDKVCMQLQALQRGLDHYEFIEFFKEKESEGEWNVWEMKFHYTDGSSEDIMLAFLRVRGHYLLGDID